MLMKTQTIKMSADLLKSLLFPDKDIQIKGITANNAGIELTLEGDDLPEPNNLATAMLYIGYKEQRSFYLEVKPFDREEWMAYLNNNQGKQW